MELVKESEHFANPNKPVNSWYVAARSKDIPVGKAKLFSVFWGLKLVVFRGENGKVAVMDSRCHHMGAQLGSGKVKGNCIRCPFHFWEYDQDGNCSKIPYKDEIPKNAKVKSYVVQEKHGLIWFFYGDDVLFDIPDFAYYEGQEPTLMTRRYLNCHPHIMLPNTVDHAHWWSVHGIKMDKTSDLDRISPYQVRHSLQGQLHNFPETFSNKLFHFLGLKKFDAEWNCYGGNLATVDVRSPMKIRFFLTYVPDDKGGTHIQTILYHPKRNPIAELTGFSKVINFFAGLLISVLFYDDLIIMKTLQFRINFTEEDKLVGKWIQYIKSLPYQAKES